MTKHDQILKAIEVLTEKLNSDTVPKHVKEQIMMKIEELIIELNIVIKD